MEVLLVLLGCAAITLAIVRLMTYDWARVNVSGYKSMTERKEEME